MMNLLLDTHAFLWAIDNDPRLSQKARDAIITENPEAEQMVTLPPLTPGCAYTWDVQGLDPDGAPLARRIGEFQPKS